MNSFPLSQLPLRSAGPILIPFFPLLALFIFPFPTQLCGGFLALFWKSNVFCQPSIDVLWVFFFFLDVFVGECELCPIHPSS